MRQQSPISVFLLTLVTFGIYGIFWLARTRGEMVRMGADIPTTFLIIVPLANIWYMWKWSKGVEHVTGGKMQGVIAFLLQWLLGAIGDAIIQDSFNKVGSQAQPAAAGAAPAMAQPAQPAAAAPQPQAAPAPTEGPTPPQPPAGGPMVQ